MDEDEPLFLSLISDLFPGITLDSATYEELQAALTVGIPSAGLVNHPAWNLKVVQVGYCCNLLKSRPQFLSAQLHTHQHATIQSRIALCFQHNYTVTVYLYSVAQYHRQWNTFCAALYWSRSAHLTTWQATMRMPRNVFNFGWNTSDPACRGHLRLLLS